MLLETYTGVNANEIINATIVFVGAVSLVRTYFRALLARFAQFQALTDRGWCIGKDLDSYSGRALFESRREHQLSLIKLYGFPQSLQPNLVDNTSIIPRPLPSR
jgi:hypothetical protein